MSHYNFFPDFSPATTIRRKTFNPVLKKMTALGLQPFLTYPVVIKLRHKGEQRSFDSPQKAEDFISSLSQRKTYAAALQDNGKTAAIISSTRRKGLEGRDAVKRTRVLEYLHRKSISCALKQETHLKQSDVACFQNKYYKLAAFSCALNKTKGVLILVNRKLHLTIEHLGNDEEGRFVFICCKIHNTRLALVSNYGPNETDSAFFTNVSKTLLEQIDCPLVVGGDFNAVVNPALDKSQSDTTANPFSKLLTKFITELNLIFGEFRILNLRTSLFFLIDKTFSRIDYIFLSPSLISSNSSISILPILLSDHSAVLCNSL